MFKFSEKLLKDRAYFIFLFVTGAVFSILIVSGNYFHTPAANVRDIVLIFFHWFIVSFAYFILIYLLSLNRWIFLLLFPVVNLISAIAVYNVFQYDISINPAIIESVLNVSLEEAGSFVSLPFLVYVLIVIVLSVLFAYYRYRKIQIRNYLVHIVLILAGFFFCRTIDKVRFKTISHRIPFSFYDAAKGYLRSQELVKENKLDISEGSDVSVDSLNVLLVFGESARADHLSLNGYKRNTCPELKTKNVISFKNFHTPWTHTNKSIPYILTRADENNLTPMYEESSVISIFKKCGFKTYWIGNQNPGDTFLPFVNNCDSVIINKPYQTTYSYAKKLDEDLLPYIDQFLKENGKYKLFVIQLMGSHWFYNSHYPESFERYTPVMKGKTIGKTDSAKMVNSYDNTILYTDHILSELIDKFKDKKAMMFYVSDHGEVLGEDNKWLHAHDTEYEKNPAVIVWFSPEYLSSDSTLKIVADENRLKRFDTGVLFHSLLQSSFITSPYLDTTKSIFHE
jgi:glucan phosphoethanolaminetransferase (alkaline phosphatase superfamily)